MNCVGSSGEDDFFDYYRCIKVYVNKCSVDKGVNSRNVNRVFVAIEQIGEREARVVEAVVTNFAEAIIARPSLNLSFNNSFKFGKPLNAKITPRVGKKLCTKKL